MPGRSCAVDICRNNSAKSECRNKGTTFYSFPKDNVIRDEWIRRCNRDLKFNVETSQICSDHFLETDFERDIRNELLNLSKKRSLKPNVVPTLKLGCIEIKESSKVPFQNLLDSGDDTAKHLPEITNVCIVSSCRVKNHRQKISLFPFPKTLDIREQWIQRCCRFGPFNVETARVCSLHFKTDDFEEDFRARILKRPPKRTLKNTAIPSILLDTTIDITGPQQTTPPPVEEIYIQCPDVNSDYSDSPVEPPVQSKNGQKSEPAGMGAQEPVPEDNIQNPKTVSIVFIHDSQIQQSSSIVNLLPHEANSTAATKNYIAAQENGSLSTIHNSTYIDTPPPATGTNQFVIGNNVVKILLNKIHKITRSIGTLTDFDIEKLPSQLPEENLFLTTESIQVICRVCLLKYGDVSLYETKYEDLNYSEVLEAVTGVKLKKENPMSICNGCAQVLIKSYLFKKQSEKSEHVLAKFKEEIEQTNSKRELANRQLDHDDIITTLETEQENEPKRLKSADNLSKTPMQPSLLVFPEAPISMFDLCDGDKKHDVDSDALVKMNEKKVTSLENNKTKTKKKLISTGTTTPRPSQGLYTRNYRNRHIRKAYRLISTGHIEEAKKMLADSTIKIPEWVLNAMDPSECKTCGEHFKNDSDYHKHARLTKHYRTPFPCDHCDRVFPSKNIMQNHKNSVLKESKLCDICGASFASNKGLLPHIKQVHSKREYKCNICGIPHMDLVRLNLHKRVVHKEFPTRKTTIDMKTEVCEFCGEKLRSKAALRMHRARYHSTTLPYECSICSAKFQNNTLLTKHQSVHILERFECGFCNVKLKEYEKLVNHRKVRHSLLSIDADVSTEFLPSQCTFCESICPNKQALSIHLKDHRIEVCAYCDDIFVDAMELADHNRKLHESVSDWMCRYCNKRYEDGKSLFSHLSLHKNKAYKCDECPTMFDSSNKLKRHKLVHNEVKNYECRFCSKKFRYQESIVAHERIHTGERPYKCDICGLGHTCSGNRNKHRRKHFELEDHKEALSLEAH